MKTLNNYITERIRVDNIKYSGFPIDGTLNEVVDFLEMNGFKEIDDPHNGFSESAIFLNDMKGKYFSVDTRDSRVLGVEFADTSTNKISEDNPLYYIHMDAHPKIKKNGFPFTKFIGDQFRNNISGLTPDEFKKEMESYFG